MGDFFEPLDNLIRFSRIWESRIKYDVFSRRNAGVEIEVLIEKLKTIQHAREEVERMFPILSPEVAWGKIHDIASLLAAIVREEGPGETPHEF